MNDVPVCDSENATSGWQARLDLEFDYRKDKTVLSHHRQYGPLAVQRVFYPEGDVCHLYVLHPPGGVVGGDSLVMNTLVEDHASALLTTPGATKFYRSPEKTAYQQQTFHVKEHGMFEWLPQENIFFPGAQVHMNTQINLAADAHFIGLEIHCLGLPACNKKFLTGALQLDFSLSRAERPVLIERLKVDANSLNASAGLRGNAVTGMFVATPGDRQLLEDIREMLSPDKHSIATTLIDGCLLIRYLGDSTQKCHHLFVQAWHMIRPRIFTREACPPRIWAT